jgi:hypothetical protein
MFSEDLRESLMSERKEKQAYEIELKELRNLNQRNSKLKENYELLANDYLARCIEQEQLKHANRSKQRKRRALIVIGMVIASVLGVLIYLIFR